VANADSHGRNAGVQASVRVAASRSARIFVHAALARESDRDGSLSEACLEGDRDWLSCKFACRPWAVTRALLPNRSLRTPCAASPRAQARPPRPTPVATGALPSKTEKQPENGCGRCSCGTKAALAIRTECDAIGRFGTWTGAMGGQRATDVLLLREGTIGDVATFDVNLAGRGRFDSSRPAWRSRRAGDLAGCAVSDPSK
jgi:hypothetical protein